MSEQTIRELNRQVNAVNALLADPLHDLKLLGEQVSRLRAIHPAGAVLTVGAIGRAWFLRTAQLLHTTPDRVEFPSRQLREHLPHHGQPDELAMCIAFMESVATTNDPPRDLALGVVEMGDRGLGRLLMVAKMLGIRVVDLDPNVPDFAALVAQEALAAEQRWAEEGG